MSGKFMTELRSKINKEIIKAYYFWINFYSIAISFVHEFTL
jgi:hypothetical protein